ncbi:MAG TPA: 2'-5' RNA ligase family protein [Gemmatimonadaceae bacterium]|nr:2'-5' RNA ligase family protein [Gemmatimonadaceae bacterium]
MKSGIVLLAELAGPVADRIHEIQKRFDPRMAAELPPHITLTGSSGMGPIPATISLDRLRALLEPIARETPPLTVYFQPPMKFMQSPVVVLPIDPHGPIRALHERVKKSGIPSEPPRFAFTPHCTLSFYPELSREKLRDLLALRIDEPVLIDRIAAYKAVTLTRAENVLELPLTGALSS